MTEICLFGKVSVCLKASLFSHKIYFKQIWRWPPNDKIVFLTLERALYGIQESGKVKIVDKGTWILFNTSHVNVISILQVNTNKSNRRTQNFHLFKKSFNGLRNIKTKTKTALVISCLGIRGFDYPQTEKGLFSLVIIGFNMKSSHFS